MTPRIISENGQPKVEGNYSFKLSEFSTFDPEANEATKDITFKWSPEMPNDVDKDLTIEMLCQKLRDDFYAFVMSHEKQKP